MFVGSWLGGQAGREARRFFDNDTQVSQFKTGQEFVISPAQKRGSEGESSLIARAFQALVVGATLFDSRFPGTSGSTPGSITRGR